MFLIDTHAHLDDEQFEGEVESVLQRAQDEGVRQIVVVGSTAESSQRCVAMATEHPCLFAAVGLQPNYLQDMGADDWDRVVALSADENVVAIGETGLDHYWESTPLALQERVFLDHIRLSQSTSKPFIVHLREPQVPSEVGDSCAQHILACLRKSAEAGPLCGVMHSYTGSLARVGEFVELGLYISLAGMVTYKRSHDLREMAAVIPRDRLLVETDAPYLSPEPVRKIRRNEPAHVRHTAACLADVRGVTLEELAAMTTANAQRLFGLAPLGG